MAGNDGICRSWHVLVTPAASSKSGGDRLSLSFLSLPSFFFPLPSPATVVLGRVQGAQVPSRLPGPLNFATNTSLRRSIIAHTRSIFQAQNTPNIAWRPGLTSGQSNLTMAASNPLSFRDLHLIQCPWGPKQDFGPFSRFLQGAGAWKTDSDSRERHCATGSSIAIDCILCIRCGINSGRWRNWLGGGSSDLSDSPPLASGYPNWNTCGTYWINYARCGGDPDWPRFHVSCSNK